MSLNRRRHFLLPVAVALLLFALLHCKQSSASAGGDATLPKLLLRLENKLNDDDDNPVEMLPRLKLLTYDTTESTVSFTVERSGVAAKEYALSVDAVNCTDCAQTPPPVRDANQTKIELEIGRLRPGKEYNVTVTPITDEHAGDPLVFTIRTVPTAPVNVVPANRRVDGLVLQWSLPGDVEFTNFEADVNGHELSTREMRLKLPYKFAPGQRVNGFVRTVSGEKKSNRTEFAFTTEPSPPANLSLSISMARQCFLATVHLTADNVVCHLNCSQSGQTTLVQGYERQVKAENNTCKWCLSLTPGVSYNFASWTSKAEASSAPLVRQLTAAPAFDLHQFNVGVTATEDQLRVSWNRSAVLAIWERVVGKEVSLTATLKAGGFDTANWAPIQRTALNSVHFDHLKSGACYAITVGSYSKGSRSDNVTTLLQRTEMVQLAFALYNVSSDTAWFKSPYPKHVVMDSSCELRLVADDVKSGQVYHEAGAKITIVHASAFFKLTQLRPYTNYNLRMKLVCGFEQELCPQESRALLKRVVFQTADSTPGPVRGVEPIVLSPFAVNVHWKPVEEPNGELMAYVLRVQPILSSQHLPFAEAAWTLTLPPSATNCTVSNLTGGMEYAFDVLAANRFGLGPLTGQHFLPTATTPIWAPPKPFEVPHVVATSLHQRDFLVRFNLSAFSTRHGFLEKYAIIVSEGADPVDSNTTLAWHDVQSLAKWPPYIAIVKPLPMVKHFSTAPVIEAIGVDGHCVQLSHEEVLSTFRSQFCNGPLRPARQYRVKLRLYTRDSLFTDGDYSPVVVTTQTDDNPSGPMLTAILTLIVFLTCVMIALLMVKSRRMQLRSALTKWLAKVKRPKADLIQSIFYPTEWLRRTRGSKFSKRAATFNDAGDGRVVNSSLSLVPSSYRLSMDSDSGLTTSRPVTKADFAKYYQIMSADSDLLFSEEFDLLKGAGRNLPMAAADLTCNRLKNRFTNILPYDHSRVKLCPTDDDEGSDYVNANYVSGYNGPREYIVCQGPMTSTRDDFWRMVWEQHCLAVVNLTRCVEKGREKCDEYWPTDTKMVAYGEVEVVLLNECRFPLWTMRELLLQKNGLQRRVKKFHFTSWPDFGVPSQPKMLLDFVLLFRSQILDNTKPIVVHCSAGVGRSGTFVALDNLLQQIRTSDLIDVFSIVYKMRTQRMLMVQSEQQYIFIYKCLLVALERNEGCGSKVAMGNLTNSADLHRNLAFDDEHDEGIVESGV